MKIAVISDDGKTISQHFGRARHYVVFTIKDGKILSHEMRDKLGHDQFGGQGYMEGQHHEEHGHGDGHHSHQKHVGMIEAIKDCKALICGGMGRGAYDSLLSLNIQPIVTDLQEIEPAVQAYLDGHLIDHTEKLH